MKKLKYFLAVFALIFVSASFMMGCDDLNGTYEVEIEICQHGIITVDKSSAKAGETINISAVADNGYELAVISCNGVALDSMKFTMPKDDVTLSALFKSTSTGSGEAEQPLTLHKGTYVCRSLAIVTDNGDYSYIDNAEYYIYNYLTFKELSKVDAKIYVNGSYQDVNNVSYTRDGNTLTGRWEEFDFEAKLIDNNTIALKADNTIHIYYYIEDVKLSSGIFSGSTNGYNMQINFINNDQFNVEVENADSQTIITQASGNYYIRGNRLYASAGNFEFFSIIPVDQIHKTGNDVTSFSFSYILKVSETDIYFTFGSNAKYSTYFNKSEI